MTSYERERGGGGGKGEITSFTPHPQLKEIFGAGTACVVCPVNRILYLDEVFTFSTSSLLLFTSFGSWLFVL